MHTQPLTPEDLRTEILRHWRRPMYHLAAEVNVHPATLSGMLRGRLPLPVAVTHRVLDALDRAKQLRRVEVSRPLGVREYD